MSHLVGTDILVDYQRRNAEALNYLAELGDWSYSVATEMELAAGARNRDEIAAIVHTLYPYRKVPLTPETGELASNIMKEFSGSRDMDPLDAIIAASALSEGLILSTRNRKHFSGIPGLEIEVPDYDS